MPDITREDVEHIARLARIKLRRPEGVGAPTGVSGLTDEVTKLTGELGSILTYVSKLNEIDTTGVEPTAQVTGLEAGEFVHMFGDVHLYSNHFDQAKEQMVREPRDFPTLKLNKERKEIDDFVFEDIQIENYDPHPPIKAEIANIGGFDKKDPKLFTMKN